MKRTGSIISSVMGNALEFYDTSLVMVYALTLSDVFFPKTDSLLLSVYRGIGVFALGLLCRPIGALLFGYIGDVYGRKRVLFLSMVMMAVPSFVIAVLPNYDMIGILAPILLMLSRIVQGICTGGEYNSAAIYALENTTQRKGLIGSFVTASGVLGMALATFMKFVLDFVPGESWRVAFLLGTSVALFGIYVRTKLLESPEFVQRKIHQRHPLLEAITDYRKQCVLTFFVGGQTAVMCYAVVAGVPAYLKFKGFINLDMLPKLELVGSFSMVASCIFFGYLSDYFDKRGRFITLSGVLVWLVYPFAFWAYQHPHLNLFVMGHSALALLAGLHIGTQHKFFQDLFPAHLRCSAISLFFSLGLGLLGACVPLWFVSHSIPWLCPAIYTLFTAWMVWQFYPRQIFEGQVVVGA